MFEMTFFSPAKATDEVVAYELSYLNLLETVGICKFSINEVK